MANMIPNYIDSTDTRRGGERMVFDWFSDEKIKGTAYYSLLQKNHRHKLIGEVDFLYVCERGFLCVEVKGGQDIFCKEKQWFAQNRNGDINEIKNPFIQAKDCMYALKNYFIETYGRNTEQANYLIGYAVIFPECIFTGIGNDLVTQVMFDARYNIEDFNGYLKKVFDYWETQEIDKHNFYPKLLTAFQLNQANDLLRGDFCVVPSLSLELQHIEQRMIRLTEEQFDALDITDYNKRVIIQGAAGTGKSLLALEKVRKCAAKEQKVLYLCFNRNMAKYAFLSLKSCNMDYVTVLTYHALLQAVTKIDLHNKSLYEASKVFLEDSFEVAPYDYLVIDEGQDLINTSVFDVLNYFLFSGFKKGSWSIFLDQNQSIFTNLDEYNFAFEYLIESTSPTSYKLNRNCRNTEQIARKTTVLSLIPPVKYSSISGPKVITRACSDRNEIIKNLRKELQSLFSGGISSTDVVILSPKRLFNSILSTTDSICNLKIIERNSIDEFGKRCLNYFTVQSFKGLESKIVFYIDIDGFRNENCRKINYVALSRAKQLLYIFFDATLKDEHDDIVDEGQELL